MLSTELNNFTRRFPEIAELVTLIQNDILQSKRPADEIIWDDVELRERLNVSKRLTAYWREQNLITHSKVGSKIFYRLSDVLKMLKEHEIPSITSGLKIKLWNAYM